jgi:hypothetical protein
MKRKVDLLLLTETFEAIKKAKPKSQTLRGESTAAKAYKRARRLVFGVRAYMAD